MGDEVLKFVPFNSFVDLSFWTKLTDAKLHEFKLDDSKRHIWGHYTNSSAAGVPCRFSLDFEGLHKNASMPPGTFVSHGRLLLKNTIESFKDEDKQAILNELGAEIWADIQSGRAIDDSSFLSRFCLLCFIDIKRYHYYYWFAFPALAFPYELRITSPATSVTEVYTSDEVQQLYKACAEFTQESACGYFLVKACGKTKQGLLLQVHPLSRLPELTGSSDKDWMLGFCDPSTEAAYPGWTLRNLLALYAYHSTTGKPTASHNVSVLCWRNRSSHGKVDYSASVILDVTFTDAVQQECPRVMGWEKNNKGLLAPMFADLSATMDANKLAKSAVNLNLQLMKWRLVPDLNLDLLSEQRCLLLGAGTLGSNVARCLLGWGVHRLSFVDNARVSYSNPVRQSLFGFEDCANGGQLKAHAAANAMKRIYPNVNCTSHTLTIPMPGHVVDAKEVPEVLKTIDSLTELVKSHDIIFLLTDTRESRWLPTLLGAFYNKIVLSIALGYDSYLVVRHGYGRTSPSSDFQSQVIPGNQLACYFCSDVVAPVNSTKGRTLDQQCTVTRPGVSYIASALGVELLVSLLQHPQRALAPAETADRAASEASSPLGIVPHQVRGFLSRFEQFTPAVPRFGSCVACSEKVIREYETKKSDFLLSVFSTPNLLEDITGLAELQTATENIELLELSDAESV